MRMIIFALLLAISYAQTVVGSGYKYELHLQDFRCVSNNYWTGRADTLDECAVRCGTGFHKDHPNDPDKFWKRANPNNQALLPVVNHVPFQFMTWVAGGDQNCACQPACVTSDQKYEAGYVTVHRNTATPGPTAEPTKNPTMSPSMSPLSPTGNPTANPTKNPSMSPTGNPTANPTKSPIRVLAKRCGKDSNGEPISYAVTCGECPNTPEGCNGDDCHMWTFSTDHVTNAGRDLITAPASQCQPKCCTGREEDCRRYPWDVRRLIKIFCDEHDRDDGREDHKKTKEYRYAGALRRLRNAKRNGFRFSQKNGQCPRAVEPCNIWNNMHEDLKPDYSKENWNNAKRHLENLKRWYDEETRGQIALNCNSYSDPTARVECPNAWNSWN